MADNISITTTGNVPRKELLLYVDVADEGKNTPEWEVQGYNIEDSSISYSFDETTTNDILGITTETVDTQTETADFSPNNLRAGHKLAERLLYYHTNRQLEKLSNFTCMVVYRFAQETGGTYKAYVDKNCKIRLDSLGGSSYVQAPFSVTFSGDRTHGTVDTAFPDGDPTFTPSATI